MPFILDEKLSAPNCRIVEKANKRFIFLLDDFFVENFTVRRFNFNGKESVVKFSNKQIIFSTKSHRKTVALPQECSDFVCNNIHHINYVKFDTPSFQHIIFFNTLNGKLKTFDGKEILQDNNTFTIRQPDSSQIILYIDKDGLKTQNHHQAVNPWMIANNFMNEIKKGDFTSALNYLSPSLKEHQDEISLKEYFGDISFIFPLDLHNIFAISSGENKLFTFEIDRGKITDIAD